MLNLNHSRYIQLLTDAVAAIASSLR